MSLFAVIKHFFFQIQEIWKQYYVVQ